MRQYHNYNSFRLVAFHALLKFCARISKHTKASLWAITSPMFSAQKLWKSMSPHQVQLPRRNPELRYIWTQQAGSSVDSLAYSNTRACLHKVSDRAHLLQVFKFQGFWHTLYKQLWPVHPAVLFTGHFSSSKTQSTPVQEYNLVLRVIFSKLRNKLQNGTGHMKLEYLEMFVIAASKLA